jgi:DNA-binding NtrC family response regulator
MKAWKIFLWDADPPSKLICPLQSVIEAGPGGAGASVQSFVTAAAREPCEMMLRFAPDVVLLVLKRGGLDKVKGLLRSVGVDAASLPVIAVIEDGAADDAPEVLQIGTTDFIFPPLRSGEIFSRIQRLLPNCRSGEASISPASRRGAGRLLGRSPKFLAELNKLPHLGECDAGVLIQGETGTGKELFARAIHDLSRRASKPFVPINCGAIPTELADSELFGHERGAFTGAHARYSGVIAQADGGTLFLDEVPSLPLLMQVKLLRFLQEKEFRPVGSSTTQSADVRVIAAGNIDLEKAVACGKFRQDLYYRLNVLPVSLPPLRERSDDIPFLSQSFLSRLAQALRKPIKDFSSEALEKLLRHDWPGNVRELEHVIERAVVFSMGTIVDGREISVGGELRASPAKTFREAKARTIDRFERNYIESLLVAHRGNITRAAQAAGKNRRAFWELIRKHHIEAEQYRAADCEV